MGVHSSVPTTSGAEIHRSRQYPRNRTGMTRRHRAGVDGGRWLHAPRYPRLRSRRHRADRLAAEAAGRRATAVGVALARSVAEMGVVRTARTLARVNQRGRLRLPRLRVAGPGRAPQRRRSSARTAPRPWREESDHAGRVTPEFFAAHSIAELAARTDHWLGKQGRLTAPDGAAPGRHPLRAHLLGGGLRPGRRAAPRARARTRRSSTPPGRTSNEAAFLYQLFVRSFGTNNLPDCSNMCHESCGTALNATIGIGKGTVTLEDFARRPS